LGNTKSTEIDNPRLIHAKNCLIQIISILKYFKAIIFPVAQREVILLWFKLLIIMLNFIGYVFYGIAIADFLGMFFGYDFTGQFWTPYLFGAIGAGCQSLGSK
tara:strand:+ start:70 stop:378 length:309 start_codon:yes stop_codon:yes gene_type:complete